MSYLNLSNDIKACQKCHLHKLMPEGCTPVPGVGNTDASLMLVGEALGETESLVGEPFIGACGKYLDKMLLTAGIQREDIYIANVVNCRPTDNGKKNRPPTKQEINACKPWLWEQIKLVEPKVIVTLGKVPAELLLKIKFGNKITLKSILGTTHKMDYCEAQIIPCYHPSYLMVHNKAATQTCIKILKKAKDLNK